jgi:TM2 domain-containing membrane protein YozV
MSSEEKETAKAEESTINGNVVFYLSIFLGWFGIDRFYVKKTSSGVLKLLTAGGCGIWWIVDLIFILTDQFTDVSGKAIKMQGNKTIRAVPCIVSLPCFFCLLLLWSKKEEMKLVDKISIFAEQPENLDSLQYYCIKDKKKFSRVLKKCEVVMAPIIAAEKEAKEAKKREEEAKEREKEAAKKETKEYKYNEMYGKVMTAYDLYILFRDVPLKAAEACKKSPVQLEAFIMDMGANSFGKYMDLRTGIRMEKADVRVFLEDSEWNNNIIRNKIKRHDKVTIGGLCYGQTETFGIKSKIVIGNAKILKKSKEYL